MFKLNDIFYENEDYNKRADFCNENGYVIVEIKPNEKGRRFQIQNIPAPTQEDQYNNVHGKLCNGRCAKDCNASNVIFGIDDNLIQTQGAVPELRFFSKTYRKMLNSDSYSISLPPNDGKTIEIKFYGHSLSEADYSYFQSIFDYYDLYSNSNVSLIFYYSKGFENYDAVYKLISAYGKSFDNKEKGKNLIHKLLLENRLHIQEIKVPSDLSKFSLQ